MVFFEGALAALAYASVIVATLRAGSRALYLTEHDSIGVMQGPPILGPHEVDNGTQASPVWDLSYPFQEGVRLALFPHSFQYQQDEIVEPELYNMAPHSSNPAPANEATSTDALDAEDLEYFDGLVEQVIAENDKTSVFRRYAVTAYRAAWTTAHQVESTLAPRLASTKEWMQSQQWKRPVWLGFKQVQPEENDEAEEDWDDEEEDWDYLSSRSSDLEYNNTSGDSATARITVHAPDTFADLRSRFGLSASEFQTSMLESGPFISFQSNSKGAARAGGVFFFTRDGSYMVKSIKKAEAQTLLEMLPKYHKYMRYNGRRSLLTRFCGMYTVKIKEPSNGFVAGATKEQEHIFVIMNSVFPAEGSQFITERYDLKGSTVGRECSEEEKINKGSNAVLKDLDIAKEVELVKSLDRPSRRASGYGFHLGETTKAALLSQLRRDVKLLVECKVMDYSLLVGVVNMDTGRFDVSTMEAVDQSDAYESAFRQQEKWQQRRAKKFKRRLSTVLTPFQIMSAPIMYFGRRAISCADSTLSSILTLPLPYYGAGICGVDSGGLSMVEGTRTGKRATYYLGLIDFLQPWTGRKVVERQLKGLLGYDVHAISCVAPEEYASRFLEFLDSHIS
jgi:hypothetical protein